MDLKLIYILIITLLPAIELRGGMPLAILYAREIGVSVFLMFFLIVLINVLLIFIVFYFLDKIHVLFSRFDFYRRFFKKYLGRFQGKVDGFEKRHERIGFWALVLFVSIPLPGTGVWSGGLISWILGLDRKKSILSMALGVLISGTLVFLGTLGFIGLFS